MELIHQPRHEINMLEIEEPNQLNHSLANKLLKNDFDLIQILGLIQVIK